MARHTNIRIRKLKRLIFLKDVFVISLTAFGGPQVHFVQFVKRLVKKKHYLTEEDLKELNSFCQMLPGPTSTQTVTAIGFKLGGPFLAFLTLAIWILPACVIMFFLALLLSAYGPAQFDLGFFKYIQPMAIGFMVYAAVTIGQMFAKTITELLLLIIAAQAAIFMRTPLVFPIILLFGGIVSNVTDKKKLEGYYKITNVRWDNFILFVSIFLISAAVAAYVKSNFGVIAARPFLLFENTYRYGSIVFGGGNVLIPMIYEQFVNFKQYLSAPDFITGLGLLQAIPGPVFSFSAFACGMSMSHWGKSGILLGSVVGSIGIFLPGILLIFFLYPIWDQFKGHPRIQKAISGINASSAGLVVASAYLLFEPLGFNWLNMFIVTLTAATLYYTRISPPIVVGITLLCGIIF